MAIRDVKEALSGQGLAIQPPVVSESCTGPLGIAPDSLGQLDEGCTYRVVVEISGCRVLNDPAAELLTYSLGSCIGVTVWDPVVHVGGMLHFMLPDSTAASERHSGHEAMFADTGLPLLFRSAYKLGAVKKRLVVKVAGGATLFRASEEMNIGRQNYAVLRNIFSRNGINIAGEHVGDTISRTMRMSVGTGRVTVQNRRMGRIDI